MATIPPPPQDHVTDPTRAVPYYTDDTVTLWHGDALTVLRDFVSESVDCIVTSPPYYGLRDYGVEGQYGLEESPAAYVETMRAVFAEARRVLAADGTLWLDIGDTYSTKSKGSGGTAKVTLAGPATGSYFESRSFACDRPEKNLLGIPWRVAFALQDDGWTLRNAIVWHKPNAMPESVTDRLSGRYEHVFMLSKSQRYWFDLDAVREPADPASARPNRCVTKYADISRPGETSMFYNGKDYSEGPGRNPGDVWAIPTQPFAAAHFACMPVALADRCIRTSKPGGVVLDPFSGSGTTGLAATRLGRRYVGIDLNRDYLDLSLRTRLAQTALIDGGSVA